MGAEKRPKPAHEASEFGLDVLGAEDDMFRWFLLAFLLGKPVQSTVAVRTWRLLISRGLDTPWALLDASESELARLLVEGKYTRYNHVMAAALHKMSRQLVEKYDGSIAYMLTLSESDEQFAKLLKGLYGVGPKTAEIFMRETEEYFARRVE